MLLVHQRTLQYVRRLRRVSTQAIADAVTQNNRFPARGARRYAKFTM